MLRMQPITASGLALCGLNGVIQASFDPAMLNAGSRGWMESTRACSGIPCKGIRHSGGSQPLPARLVRPGA